MGRGAGNLADDGADAGLEIAGEFCQRLLSFGLDALGLLRLLALEPGDLLGIALEDLDGARHVADLVLALATGYLLTEVALGQTRHRAGHGAQGADDRADRQIGEQARHEDFERTAAELAVL